MIIVTLIVAMLDISSAVIILCLLRHGSVIVLPVSHRLGLYLLSVALLFESVILGVSSADNAKIMFPYFLDIGIFILISMIVFGVKRASNNKSQSVG